jgi:hypothetical protein
MVRTHLSALLLTLASTSAVAQHHSTYSHVIQRVVSMPMDRDLQRRAQGHGLSVLNLTWEDTGRFHGSSVGPNISDLTLQVRQPVGHGVRTHLLPVIRFPNFTDKTGDIPADKLWVRVGNHRPGGQLQAVPLTEVLGSLREYLTDPGSLGGSGNFLAPRDTHFLTSAQHVFLPLPASGKVEFNPVLYNYQSYPGAPAVLTLLVTRQGTSATIIENHAGDQSLQGWGQQLFFNKAGQRTAFTAERRSAVQARLESPGVAEDGDHGALQEGADMMVIVQVPLRQPERRRQAFSLGDWGSAAGEYKSAAPAAEPSARRPGGSDVEQAVLGHGQELGPFREMGGLSLERDTRFPVRVTVQFYRATSNGVVSDQDLAGVAHTIQRVYANADFVGSLVVPQGQRHRPTDWVKDAPVGRWGIVGL